MSLKHYWDKDESEKGEMRDRVAPRLPIREEVPGATLEDRLIYILRKETAKKGYMTPYDLADRLGADLTREWWVETYVALRRLLEQGLITEQPKGSQYFRIKRDKPRAKLAAYTAIFFCSACGTEVYRHQHIKVRTKKKLAEIKRYSRTELLKHARRVGHTKGGLREYWINERWGDKGFEIPGKEPYDERMSASRFAKIMGDITD